MGAEVGAYVVQGLFHPGRDVIGMQIVHQQQAGHQIIGGQRGERLIIQATELVQDGQQPLQPGAVEVRDKADQLLSPLPSDHSAGRTRVD